MHALLLLLACSDGLQPNSDGLLLVTRMLLEKRLLDEFNDVKNMAVTPSLRNDQLPLLFPDSPRRFTKTRMTSQPAVQICVRHCAKHGKIP